MLRRKDLSKRFEQTIGCQNIRINDLKKGLAIEMFEQMVLAKD